MGSSFNAQILVEKLAKLNNSQASIETLSHWCIFHMNKAKHVVETWGRQFHCSPREQRLAYLYLANDILQNSRRRGSEFVGEFWKVLPDALRDVIENGDDFGRKSARRLVNIWEERKVFGSRGQILKEEILGRQPENGTRNGPLVPLKLSVQQKPANGTPLEILVSAVEALHGIQINEDVIAGKCTNAAGYLEKAAVEVERDLSSGHTPGPAVVKEVQGQHAVLRDCIEQLGAIETSRTSLVSHLREALQEQEHKLEQVRNHLQIARFQSDRAGELCKQFADHGGSSHPPATEVEESKEAIKVSSAAAAAPQSFTHSDVEQSAPVMFASNPPTQSVVDPRKTAAAAVVAKLTASTSSAEMLSYVLSSLASEGIIGSNASSAVTETQSSVDYPPEKRPKLQNHDQSFLQQNAATTSTVTTSPPPLQPPPPPFQLQPQFFQPLQPPGPVNHTPFNYTIATTSATTQQQQQQQQQQGAWVPGLGPLPATSAPSDNTYQNFQGQDGFYGINSSVSMTPVTRQ
uniref:Regulation of nuclear pre-mRNA domain-containing protein 1B n=1 Tax=Noccaea caerulescens TaxID=107243 RepID=A0A1J3IU83_NOCCA